MTLSQNLEKRKAFWGSLVQFPVWGEVCVYDHLPEYFSYSFPTGSQAMSPSAVAGFTMTSPCASRRVPAGQGVGLGHRWLLYSEKHLSYMPLFPWTDS